MLQLSLPMIMMLALVVLLLPRMVCKAETAVCSTIDPLPTYHEWRRSGGFLLGGMASQIVYLSPKVFFKKPPLQELEYDLPM
ncbi:hypothetical protein lerEdw1_010152 [Lerista edwardsae]|nr:hypothetical protein lerEdw1_010152 [Lerista edwardsae]